MLTSSYIIYIFHTHMEMINFLSLLQAVYHSYTYFSNMLNTEIEEIQDRGLTHVPSFF